MAAGEEGGSGPDETATARLERVRERIGPVQAVWLDDAVDATAAPGSADGAAQRLGQWARGVRIDVGTRGIAALALVGATMVVVAAVVVFRDRPVAYSVPPLPPTRAAAATVAEPTSAVASESAAETVAATSSDAEPTQLVVSVVGLVRRPGLLRLPPGSRVADALVAAGGAVPGADLVSLNMAERLNDGDQVVVGSATAAQPPADEPSSVRPGAVPPSTQNPGKSGSGQSGSGNGSTEHPAAKVNLNTATEQELDALPGVGPSTAAAIVAWRRSNGRFSDIDQLREIHGIGPAKLARLRPWVTL